MTYFLRFKGFATIDLINKLKEVIADWEKQLDEKKEEIVSGSKKEVKK